MTPLKIAFSGAHSTGKTTAVNRLAELLEAEGVKTVRIGEVARKCPWPINRDATPKTQKWIWEAQRKAEEKAAETDADVILCDRTLLDSLCYTRWHRDRAQKTANANLDSFELFLRMEKKLVRPWQKVLSAPFVRFGTQDIYGYDLVFLTWPDGRRAEEDGVRSTDKMWRSEIAEVFSLMWMSVKQSIRGGCSNVTDFVSAEKCAEDVLALLRAGKER
jgi:nicotinamide riboside kinase